VTGDPPPEQPRPAADNPLLAAVVVSIALVAVAVLGGVGVSRIATATPVPSRSPTPTPFVRISPTEPPDTGPLVFTQPLSAGCAAGDSVYVVSDGGGIGRFAFDRWQLIDPIARSLSAAFCQGDQLTAVGGGGRVITIDDLQQTIRSDTVQAEDFLGLAPLADGLLVVGRAGTVERQNAGGWGLYAGGIDEDLYAIAAFSPTSAWAVGAGGVAYRLEPAGWRPVATGVTATLRAIAARSVDDAVVVGDDAIVLVWDGAWKSLEAPVHVGFRTALRVGDGTYIAGDGGTLLRLSGSPASPDFTRIDLGTTCTLRALFGRGTELWVVGSDGGQAGVWRISSGGAVFHWGQCA
jgi:hypothetical protein